MNSVDKKEKNNKKNQNQRNLSIHVLHSKKNLKSNKKLQIVQKPAFVCLHFVQNKIYTDENKLSYTM